MNAYISKKKKRCNQCTKKSTQEFLKTTKLYPKKVERRQTEKKKKKTKWTYNRGQQSRKFILWNEQ